MKLKPYRSFPDRSITAEVIDSFLKTGRASAIFGFGVVSEPQVRVHLFDDWFGRTLARDSLRMLDASAPRMLLALSLLPNAELVSAKRDTAIRFLQLDLSWDEYDREVNQDSGADGALVSWLGVDGLSESVETFFVSLTKQASDFYGAMLQRTETLVTEAIKHLSRTSARCGAIVVDAPFGSIARRALAAGNMRFLEVFPTYLSARSMLDTAAEILGEAQRDKRAEQLFTGRPVQSPVEMLFDGEEGPLEIVRAREWYHAAHGYFARYEANKTESDLLLCTICNERAIALVPRFPPALWILGEIRQLQRKHREALELFEDASAQDLNNAVYWRARAVALHKLGEYHDAHRCYAMAIYLSPRDGSLWGFYGLFLHELGDIGKARYCFMRGKELDDRTAASNYAVVENGREPALSDCPLRVLPAIIGTVRSPEAGECIDGVFPLATRAGRAIVDHLSELRSLPPEQLCASAGIPVPEGIAVDEPLAMRSPLHGRGVSLFVLADHLSLLEDWIRRHLPREAMTRPPLADLLDELRHVFEQNLEHKPTDHAAARPAR